jgi:hypothetical protein
MTIPPPPRSRKLADCIWLDRLVGKIRLRAAGELPPDYFIGAQTGIDLIFTRHFGIELSAIEAIAQLPDAELVARFLALPGVNADSITRWNHVAENLGMEGFPMAGRIPLAIKNRYPNVDPARVRTALDILEVDEGLR